jgi:hypothetical protein
MYAKENNNHSRANIATLDRNDAIKRTLPSSLDKRYRWFIRRNIETGKSCLFLEPSELLQNVVPEHAVIGYCR